MKKILDYNFVIWLVGYMTGALVPSPSAHPSAILFFGLIVFISRMLCYFLKESVYKAEQ